MNIALVGYGNFGKKYYKTLKHLKIFNQIIIYTKTKKKNSNLFSLASLKRNKINLGIIATPVETHFKIAKIFLKLRIPIILEKPVSYVPKEVQILNSISKKNKTSVIVNYSDLYNHNYLKIKKKIIKRKNIDQLNIYFKSNNKYNKKSFLPILDWLPHYFAIYFSFFRFYDKIFLKKLKTIKQKNIFSQSFEINLFIKKKNVSNFYFDNITKKKLRKFQLIYNKKKYLYNGYKIERHDITPMERIIHKLYKTKMKKNYINDLPKSIKIHKAIEKLL
tara:strand:+ start:794 stop:1621 length:828 start_codon:yes stop_codon:yes gene_type:complete